MFCLKYLFSESILYTVTLRGGSTNVDFRGFMIQGRVMADDALRTGTFFVDANNTYYQTQCDNYVSMCTRICII